MGIQIQINFGGLDTEVSICHCGICKSANKSNDLLKVKEPKSSVKFKSKAQLTELLLADLATIYNSTFKVRLNS